jgi:hypothetical protein
MLAAASARCGKKPNGGAGGGGGSEGPPGYRATRRDFRSTTRNREPRTGDCSTGVLSTGDSVLIESTRIAALDGGAPRRGPGLESTLALASLGPAASTKTHDDECTLADGTLKTRVALGLPRLGECVTEFDRRPLEPLPRPLRAITSRVRLVGKRRGAPRGYGANRRRIDRARLRCLSCALDGPRHSRVIPVDDPATGRHIARRCSEAAAGDSRTALAQSDERLESVGRSGHSSSLSKSSSSHSSFAS